MVIEQNSLLTRNFCSVYLSFESVSLWFRTCGDAIVMDNDPIFKVLKTLRDFRNANNHRAVGRIDHNHLFYAKYQS